MSGGCFGVVLHWCSELHSGSSYHIEMWYTGAAVFFAVLLAVVFIAALRMPSKPLADKPPAALAELLSKALSESAAMDGPYLARILDALFQNALVTGLFKSAPPAAGESPPAPSQKRSLSPERLAIVEQVVPLLYVALQRYAADALVVTSAFTVLCAIAPLEADDLPSAQIIYRPGSIRTRIAALREHTWDAKAAHYGTLSIGKAIIAGGLPVPATLPSKEDLRDAAEVALMCARAHPNDKDVMLWSIYCLLHAGACAATDEGSRLAQSPAVGQHTPVLKPPVMAVLPMDGDAKVGPFNTRPYDLAGWLGDNGAAAIIVGAMRRFPDAERIASVGVLALGVLVKSRADNWAALLSCDAFGAVRSALVRHNGLYGADRARDVAAALVLVEAAMLVSVTPRAAIQEGGKADKAEGTAASTLRHRT